jgi:D-3-phosphoglycerate dehydrogenase
MKVLVSAPHLIPEIERFVSVFEKCGLEIEIAEVEERLAESALLGYAGEFDAAICGDDSFTALVLQAASPRLKVISKWGTGIDSIDLEAAKQLGIQVFNTPQAFTDTVADSVLSYILAFARRSYQMDREMKSGLWHKVPARALNECTLGVIGVGNIGQAVLRRAKAFGMRLLGNDIAEVAQGFVSEVGVEMMTLDQLLGESDFVSLNCDLNPTSLQLIDNQALSRMKSEATLINTARGPVVEEPALVRALQDGAIAGAALDVFEDEPLAADSPLRQMDNVMLAPHNANSGAAAKERVHWSTLRNLVGGLGIPWPEDVLVE